MANEIHDDIEHGMLTFNLAARLHTQLQFKINSYDGSLRKHTMGKSYTKHEI